MVRSEGAYPQPMVATAAHTGETTTPFQLHEGGKFPTTRRLELQSLSAAPDEVVDEWFSGSQITIGDAVDTSERIQLVKHLFYTWRDCFARTCTEIHPTDLVEHSIDLLPNA